MDNTPQELEQYYHRTPTTPTAPNMPPMPPMPATTPAPPTSSTVVSNLQGPGTEDDMARLRAAKRAKQDLLARVRRELICELRGPHDDPPQGFSGFEAVPVCTDPFHRVPLHELPRWACSSDLTELRDLHLIELLRSTGLTRTGADAALVLVHNLCEPEGGASKRDLTSHRDASTRAKRSRWDIGWLVDGRGVGRRQCAWIEVTAPARQLPARFPFVDSMMVRRDQRPTVDPNPAEATKPTDKPTDEPSQPEPSATWEGSMTHRLGDSKKRQHDTSFDTAHASFDGVDAVPMTDELDFLPNRSYIPVQERMDPYGIYLRDDVITLRNVTEERHAMRQYLRRRALPSDYHHATPRPPVEVARKPEFLVHELLKKRELFMRVTGIVHSLRTINEQQICCFLGPGFTPKQVSRQLDLCFEAGLFRRSVPFRLESGPAVYSPASGGAFQKLAREHLSRAQVDAILGGGRWSGTSTSGRRHDLLTAELLLRCVEVGIGRMVLAETFASRLHLAGDHPAPHEAPWRHGRADGVVIRADGLPIAIELTSQTNKTFHHKVATWIQYLLDVPNDIGGADVIFVIATPPTDAVGAALKRAALAIATVIDDAAAHTVASRIGVVAWTDWFPLDRMRVDAFAELRALTLLNDGLTWKPRPFADPARGPLSVDRSRKALAVVDHAAYLGQTPVRLARPVLERHLNSNTVLARPWQVDLESGGPIGLAPQRNIRRPSSLDYADRRLRLTVPNRLRGLEM